MFTTMGLANLMEAAPAPAKGFDFAIWYVLVVIGVSAVVIFYVIKRISDIVVNRKTQAMIRQFSEIKESDPVPDDDEDEDEK